MNETEPRQKVLIVDDDADTAWAVVTMLRMEGWDAHEALDGARAIDQAVAMRPDVVVMDIAMPGVGGIEAAAVLRRAFAGAKMPRLVALTGLDERQNKPRILAGGFDVFLAKPVSIRSLLDSLSGTSPTEQGR